jgi:hypothetical protein
VPTKKTFSVRNLNLQWETELRQLNELDLATLELKGNSDLAGIVSFSTSAAPG